MKRHSLASTIFLLVGFSTSAANYADVDKIYDELGIKVDEKINTKKPCGSKMQGAQDKESRDNNFGGTYYNCTLAKTTKVRITAKSGKIEHITTELGFESPVAKDFEEVQKSLSKFKPKTESTESDPGLRIFSFKSGGKLVNYTFTSYPKGIYTDGPNFTSCNGKFIRELVANKLWKELCNEK
ncbi:MAG: hypothetical protein JST80_10895 [Bdellovibrionales bacterium]|nr:hypothetical protein [Bdellovibrionales bacterium]